MSIRYSYGDFTTKGHGVIEGYYSYGKKTKSKKSKKPNKQKNTPKTLRLITQTEDRSKAMKFIGENDKEKDKIIKDIDAGKVIRSKGYTIRKSGNLYKIYQLTKSKASNVVVNKEASHALRVDEAYKHLLNIKFAKKKK